MSIAQLHEWADAYARHAERCTYNAEGVCIVCGDAVPLPDAEHPLIPWDRLDVKVYILRGGA